MISGIKEVAYAAVASTSAGSEPASTTEVTSPAIAAPLPEIATRTTEEGVKQREAELAAAWRNWKQIRESIVGSHLTAQIADAAAAELKEVKAEDPSLIQTDKAEEAAESESDASSNAAGESTAIASIGGQRFGGVEAQTDGRIARKMSDKKEKRKKK